MTTSRQQWAREKARSVSSRAEFVLTVGALTVMLMLGSLDEPGPHVPPPDRLGLILLAWAPLLMRTRWPAVALVATVAGECLYVAMVPLVPPLSFTALPLAGMVATYSFAARRPAPVAWVSGGAATVVLLVVGVLTRPSEQLASTMFAVDMMIGATAAGVWVRNRRERLTAMEQRALRAEQTKHQEVRQQVAAERLRIARELHDVLAHNLALVNAQAAVADYLLQTDPVAASKALRGISEHTGQALNELRATVGLLRQDDDAGSGTSADGGLTPEELHPTPGLARLEDLVEGFRAAGMLVGVTIIGLEQPLSAHADLAAYRITQEALTNASKHAPGAPVVVLLDWCSDVLQLRISNEAPTELVPCERTAGTGHGLIGMRERALVAGGAFSSGTRPEGGFVVTATIPLNIDSGLDNRVGP